MRIIRVLCMLSVTISIISLFGCQKEDIPPTPTNERTLFMYLPWSTNLTDYFYNNIADMEEAISRTGLSKERVIVFLSTSASEAEMFEIVYENKVRRLCTDIVRKRFRTVWSLCSSDGKSRSL